MNLSSILDAAIASLEKRQKDIITRRFGIQGTKPMTLARLGEKYGITRERVRQIETDALKELRSFVKGDDAVMSIHRACVDHINSLGGVRRRDVFIDDAAFVLKDKEISGPYISLLFSIVKSPIVVQENNEMHAMWAVNKDALSKNKKFIDKVAQTLSNKKEKVLDQKQFDDLFAGVVHSHTIPDFIGLNYLLNSKLFAVNVYGDFGLSHWPEIRPKTVRDKSYLVLKKKGEPLHFRHIAQEINAMEFDAKRAHPQTVHNELIKDSRFVLVGRGLYSLREFGVEPGTTKDVIHSILKKQGPLGVDHIVELVSSQRILKRNTIVLNLQNKRHFKRLSDGTYHIA